ncbi:MAG: thioredoxin [Candidatus Limivicinus sp.]|nr:thioredoxin [Clostridiales bacterium]MCI7136523.1 thioredoxin [Clostridiales bacterium]MDY6132992.1 thioredoxin [Candidatus Limivicinus sp.]
MAEIIITEQNFEQEVLKADKPVLVDFWATWCGPCRMLAPTIELLAEEMEGVAKVGKVNVDEQPGLAARFGISSIPTLIVFEDGKVKNTSVGVVPKSMIEDMLR